jgi:hypothetical protein
MKLGQNLREDGNYDLAIVKNESLTCEALMTQCHVDSKRYGSICLDSLAASPPERGVVLE